VKAKLNKNVNHNGKDYAKGSEISKSDEGFDVLVKSGHADLVGGQEQVPEQLPEGSESEEQSESHSKSGKKSKR